MDLVFVLALFYHHSFFSHFGRPTQPDAAFLFFILCVKRGAPLFCVYVCIVLYIIFLGS